MSNYIFSIESFFSYFSIGYKKRRVNCIIAGNIEELSLFKLNKLKTGMTIDIAGVTYVKIDAGFIRYK
jgi:hypothetical protein